MIRADVHVDAAGRPKGTGIVAFETSDDARNAIQQFNGYDWQGRMLEVREDRYANPMGGGGGFAGRGGYGGALPVVVVMGAAVDSVAVEAMEGVMAGVEEVATAEGEAMLVEVALV